MKKLFKLILLTFVAIATTFAINAKADKPTIEEAYFKSGFEAPEQGYLLFLKCYENYDFADFYIYNTDQILKFLDDSIDNDNFNDMYGLNFYDHNVQFDFKIDDGEWLSTNHIDKWNVGDMEMDNVPYDMIINTYNWNQNQYISKISNYIDLSYSGNDAGFLAPYILGDPEHARFDKNHTYSIRFRYFLHLSYSDADDEYLVSDWAPTITFGKTSNQEVLTKPTSMSAPTLSNFALKTVDGGIEGYFNIDIPHEAYLGDLYWNQEKNYSDNYYIDTEVSINGGDWEKITIGNPEWLYKNRSLSIDCDLDDYVRLRARIISNNSEEYLESAYSNILALNSPASGGDPTTTDPTTTTLIPGSDPDANQAKDSCPICHFCPQPLGICIFIWIIIIAAIVALVYFGRKLYKKFNEDNNNKKNNNEQ